jgi:hypothetical protein
MKAHKSECRSGVRQVAEKTANSLDFAINSKAIANQIALLALAGHHVIKGERGDFTVCKYGLTRYCADFAELQAFARQLGVNHE